MNSMRAAATLRVRAVAAGIAVVVLILYYREHAQRNDVFEYLRGRVSSCESNAESIAVKLKVIFDHKQKMENLYLRTRNQSEISMNSLKENLRRCELNGLSSKNRLTTCESELESSKVKLLKKVEAPARDEGSQGQEEMKRRIEELERQLNQSRAQLEAALNDNEDIKKRAADCEGKLVAHIGALPKGYYTLNDTAHFERNHRKGDKLTFEREEAVAPPPKMIPGKELVKKLEEREKKRREGKEEEEEKHPEDREEKDDYVAERQNGEEQDYKEAAHV